MKVHTLFSHRLTDIQISELSNWFSPIIGTLTPELQKLWSQVPTAKKTPNLSLYVKPILDFLEKESEKGDIVFVQGEFGLTILVVQWCFANERVPIYATTQRRAVEVHNEDGTVSMKHIFEHAGFREYEKL